MTKPIDPYSRVYWRVVEDERFSTIYGDDHHFAAWVRLLMLADATYPTVAPIPATARPASVKALAACGLIDLLPGGLYRVHGLAAERERRSRPGPDADPSGNPTGTPKAPARPKADPDRSLARAGVEETSKDENEESTDEQTPAPAFGLSDDETAVFVAIAKAGATIRPESGMGQRVLGLLERNGTDVVTVELARIIKNAGRKLSDRQIVFGLEAALEAVPTAQDAKKQDQAELVEARERRRDEAIWKRRMDWYRAGGKWDEGWGPEPVEGAVA